LTNSKQNLQAVPRTGTGTEALTSEFLSGPRLNGVDVFFAFNLLLFMLMCVFAYYARWTKYAGNGRITEFFFYALVIMLAITALWIWLRRYAYPAWLLVVIELGIMLHFAGGLVYFGGARLYDHIYFGIRYDKYVHFANAFFATLVVQEIFRIKNLPINAFTRLVIYFVALGLGSCIEICEYVVTLTIPQNGVGGYDDNLRDLIANSCGGALFLALRGRVPGLRRRPPTPDTVPDL
jgi:uncharacterized membrane protein YjdF